MTFMNVVYGVTVAFRLLVLVGLTWALSVVVTPTPDPFLVAVGGLAAAGLVLLVPPVRLLVFRRPRALIKE